MATINCSIPRIYLRNNGSALQRINIPIFDCSCFVGKPMLFSMNNRWAKFCQVDKMRKPEELENEFWGPGPHFGDYTLFYDYFRDKWSWTGQLTKINHHFYIK